MKGYRVYWSGKGPDGGRDLLCIEHRDSFFCPDEKRWLIQCKHNAHSGKSVGVAELDNIIDSCEQHDAEGYILACSTQPSSGVVNRLEAITNNVKNKVTAIYWDAVIIEQMLSNPNLWRVAQRFMPISSEASSWNVYATESPNHWVVNYSGYYFHLANRIGSNHEHHFDSIKNRIKEIEALDLPEKHFIRIRSIYFDDKNGNYIWYIDYMYPHDETPSYSSAAIKQYLGDGYALDDGQHYTFEVMLRDYLQWSDHYDPDHYDYYSPYINSFLSGNERQRTHNQYEEAVRSDFDLKDKLEKEMVDAFNSLNEKFKELKFLRVIRSSNARMEDLDKFNAQQNWSELIFDLDIDSDRFFSSWFFFNVENDDEFHKFISYIPQQISCSFRLTKAFIYIPNDDMTASKLSSDDNELLYELTFSIHPAELNNKFIARKKLNEYFNMVSTSIDKYLEANKALNLDAEKPRAS